MTRLGLTLSLTAAALMALASCGRSSNNNQKAADTDVASGKLSGTREQTKAQPQQRGPRPSLPELGTTTDEGKAARRGRMRVDRKQRFERFDTDGDGQLSGQERLSMRAEREAVREKRAAKRGERMNRIFESVDSDGDGTLSRDELGSTENRRLARLLNRFEEIDTDGDGGISSEEMTAMLSKRSPRNRRGRPGQEGDQLPSTP